jgi:DNA invertase Pin-like site-specific DNA recombinase
MSTMRKYYPKSIDDSKFENNKLFYLISWKGYVDQTWEPEENIYHLDYLIQEYNNLCLIGKLSLKNNGYIYVRVSSKKQSEYSNGNTSLEVQEKMCRNYCDETKTHVLEVVREVYSAKNMDKLKGLQYLLNIAIKGQTIYIYDISRFSRNIKQALNILEESQTKGINIFSVTEKLSYLDPYSRNLFRIQLCAANFLSESISQKVNASIAFRRERGDVIGSVSFGYMTKKEEKTNIRIKIPNPEEIRIIDIVKDCVKYKKNIKKILSILNFENILFRGKKPTFLSVNRLVTKIYNNNKYPEESKQKESKQKKSKQEESNKKYVYIYQ